MPTTAPPGGLIRESKLVVQEEFTDIRTKIQIVADTVDCVFHLK